jgi:hypothetical protein
MNWLNPGTIAMLAIVAAAGVFFGRIRHETPATMAMNVGGYTLFMIGLGWAQSFGGGALLAAGAASLGSLMFTSTASRKPRPRNGGMQVEDRAA